MAVELEPLIEIVGIKDSSRGRSCEIHRCCGEALTIDSVVRFRSIQILNGDVEETAIAVYWVTDGIDRCRVGFLPRECVQYKEQYEDRVAQVVEFLQHSESP
eukprot:CAMPEP_0116102218 /NCGR_PEP_ID=MMETSP0327-20121206/13229_1 /TAXON_ID=44447 /ORGANISM="Pseudo-nitzschia delicatissima, Strain B596" /LENGTH=101 /DNA_ID=CAMNT_0003594237 /DNA_START=34 /DNA_END=335 /DNA_ORIENTATION=+